MDEIDLSQAAHIKPGMAAEESTTSRAGISMMKKLGAFWIVSLALVPISARAQSINPLTNPNQPEVNRDINGVDYVSGTLNLTKNLFSYGDPSNPLGVSIGLTSPGCCAMSYDNLGVTTTQTDSGYILNVKSPTGSAVFVPGVQWWRPNPQTVWSEGNSGSSLSPAYEYADRSGNKMIYGTGNINIRETFASGETWDYYTNGTGTLKFIVSSRGYGIQIAGYPRKITFYNKAYVFCDENLGLDCPVVSALPTAVTFTGQALSNIVTRPDGSGFQYTTEVGSSTTGIDIKTLSEIGVPNSTITYTYDHIGYNGGPAEVNAVASVNDGLHTWTYQHNAGNGDGPTFQEVETIVNDPTGHQREGIGSNFLGILENLNDELHGGWSFDSAIGSPGYIAPEGNGMAYGYGAYSNVIAAGPFAKPGTNLPNLLWTAGYPTTCTNVLICHKPLWMKDAKGNQTDFTYSPDHGGVLTETDPADVNGVRPQKRYTYVQRYAWILNSSGGYVHASAPIWLLDSTSFCRGSAATGNPTAPCTSNDEVKTSYDYGPDSGPNNLFLRGTLVAADGVSLRSCFGNDVNGRQIWKTSPRAGLASCS